MRYYEIEGDTPASIVNKFIEDKKVSKDLVTYEVIEAGSRGLLGIGKKLSKIKIAYNEEEFVRKRGKMLLSELLDLANFPDHHIDVAVEGKRIIFDIDSTTPELLIGKQAMTLNAIEYILEKMLQLDYGKDIDIVVDVNEYRERALQSIIEKTKRFANEVIQTGKSRKLPPMNSSMRREVHQLVKEIEGLTTISIGEGFIKQISIVPERKRRD